jgi:hypothetical protein
VSARKQGEQELLDHLLLADDRLVQLLANPSPAAANEIQRLPVSVNGLCRFTI